MLKPVYALAAAAALAATPALADPHGGPMKTIVVTGAGEASAAPDMALVTIGVDAEGATAAEALRKNSAQMEATIRALKDAGVAEKDLQTANLTVGVRYDYSREGAPPRITGYQATNSLNVKLRALSKAGAIIDRAISVGANRLDGVSFTFADAKPLLDKARADAVKDARAKADLYAEAADVKLGEIIQISDGFAPTPGPIPMMARLESADQKNVPMAAGEATVSASVTLIYAIK